MCEDLSRSVSHRKYKADTESSLASLNHLLTLMSPLTQAKALTVGAIAEPSVEDDTRFLLRFLGHVNCQVQVFNPFSHLHFRAIVMQIKRKQQMRTIVVAAR